MPTLVGGGMSGFGLSGRSFDDYWKFGPPKAGLSEVQFIGLHSPNSQSQLWQNDWNNFGPAVGFSWSAPWFGKDQTTLRGGYAVTYVGGIGRASTVDTATGPGMPGASDNETFTSTSPLNLSNVMLPLPRNKPFVTVPVTERTQSITVFDNKIVSPYIQTFNL